jgi:hypothetical protein
LSALVQHAILQADWRRKRTSGNAFVVKVGAQPKLFLIGAEEDLG